MFSLLFHQFFHCIKYSSFVSSSVHPSLSTHSTIHPPSSTGLCIRVVLVYLLSHPGRQLCQLTGGLVLFRGTSHVFLSTGLLCDLRIDCVSSVHWTAAVPFCYLALLSMVICWSTRADLHRQSWPHSTQVKPDAGLFFIRHPLMSVLSNQLSTADEYSNFEVFHVM